MSCAASEYYLPSTAVLNDDSYITTVLAVTSEYYLPSTAVLNDDSYLTTVLAVTCECYSLILLTPNQQQLVGLAGTTDL